jgi:hypothetical protein
MAARLGRGSAAHRRIRDRRKDRNREITPYAALLPLSG